MSSGGLGFMSTVILGNVNVIDSTRTGSTLVSNMQCECQCVCVHVFVHFVGTTHQIFRPILPMQLHIRS